MSDDAAGAPRRACLDFRDCVLALVDAAGVRRRFWETSGFWLGPAYRPPIERVLAEADGGVPAAPAWTSERAEDRVARLFLLFIDECIWSPLIEFAAAAERDPADPVRRARLRADLERALKRDGLWDDKIGDMLDELGY